MNVQGRRFAKRSACTNEKTSIQVSILTGLERHFWIHPDLLQVCLKMTVWQKETGSLLSLSTIHGATPVDAARNVAVEQFLKSGAEWLLQIDNDVVPPANCLAVLDGIEDRKIVGLPCAMERVPGEICLAMGQTRGELHHPIEIRPGWVQVDVVGTGCMLVHRDVFLAVSSPWFQCTPIDARYVGEDFSFCAKARAAGFLAWTTFDFPCSHYKTVNLSHYWEPTVRPNRAEAIGRNFLL